MTEFFNVLLSLAFAFGVIATIGVMVLAIFEPLDENESKTAPTLFLVLIWLIMSAIVYSGGA